MGENLKQDVKIQKWILVIFIPVFMALMGFTLNSVVTLTSTKNKVEYNTHRINTNCSDIEQLQRDKADKETINRIFIMLDRIENKLDKKIDK